VRGSGYGTTWKPKTLNNKKKSVVFNSDGSAFENNQKNSNEKLSKRPRSSEPRNSVVEFSSSFMNKSYSAIDLNQKDDIIQKLQGKKK
jgi:hypothetical protein